VASHHPSKKQLMPMEQIQLKAQVTQASLVNKKAISLASPIATQTDAD